MKYWTKYGSVPTTEPDGTEGWQEVPPPPTDIPEGKNLVWLNWEWIIRDPKPADRAGYQWNWNHFDKTWVEGAYPASETVISEIEPVVNLTTSQIGTIV
jgi:hypothetical protein